MAPKKPAQSRNTVMVLLQALLAWSVLTRLVSNFLRQQILRAGSECFSDSWCALLNFDRILSIILLTLDCIYLGCTATNVTNAFK